MLLENPYFARECRQMGRRLLGLLLVLGAGLTGVSLILVLGPLGWWRASVGPNRFPFVVLQLVAHSLACLVAGFLAVDRVLAAEQKKSTLEGLRLLPASPWLCLLGKLAYPLWLIAQVWMAMLPVYVLDGVCDFTALSSLLDWTALPLVLGLAVFTVGLLLPPDFADQMRRLQQSGALAGRRSDPDLSVRIMCVVLLLVSGQMTLVLSLSHRLHLARPFLGTSLPLWAPLAAIGGVLLAVALFSARVAFSPEPHLERWAHRARCGLLVLLYYYAVGSFVWLVGSGMNPVARGIALAGIPAAAMLGLRRPARRREDPLAAGEVAWAGRRWEDPLLLQDLRVFTRFLSIRRWIFWETVLLAAFVGIGGYVARRAGTPIEDVLDGGASAVAVLGPAIVVLDASVRGWQTWGRERTANTLSLLFLTPISTRDLLRSRLLAGVIYSVIANLPLVLLFLGALYWGALRGLWFVQPAIITVAPIGALFVIACACTVRPTPGTVWTWRAEEWLDALLGVFMLGTMYGSLWLAFDAPRQSPLATGLAAGFLFTLNAFIAWGSFLTRLSLTESLRSGEVDLPG